MNLMNKLLDNLENCEDICVLSIMVRALKGEKRFDSCKGLTCDECKEQAIAMLDGLRKELNNNGWIPIEERLPENNEVVLLCSGYNSMYTAKFEGVVNGKILWTCHGRSNPQPIAWQPLPKPYKKEK